MQQKISSDFRTHWHKHHLPEISPTKQAEARAFLQPLLTQMRQDNQTRCILDIGCGDGTHAVVLVEDEDRLHYYWGIDLSPEAVNLARARTQNKAEARVKFQTGNALSLPYRAHSFDVVFSYGVIAYTGAPEAMLDEMIRVCKPGGLIGVWLYPKMGGLGGMLFEATRTVCRRSGKQISKLIVSLIVLLLPILPIRSGVNLFNASWQQCMEVVEVNLLPESLDFYTLEEVLGWFHQRSTKIEFIDPNRPVAVWVRL